MELNDIKIFLELYNNLSISKTAEKLNYTQSNVSTRLMKLEKEFNTPLFIRTRSGLEAIDATKRFYHHAKKMEETMNELYHEFALTKRQINIGATQLLSRLYYSDLYSKENPYQLHTTPSNKLSRNFMNHIYDIIITHHHLSMNENMVELNKTEALLWATSKEQSDTSQAPNILMSRDKHCPLRELTKEMIKSLKLNYCIVEVDTLDLMLSFLCTTNCIALLPEKIIKEDKRLSIFDSLPPMSLEVFLYCHLSLDLSKQLDIFTNRCAFS